MGNFFINLANSMISGIGSTINLIIDALPNSPFQVINNTAVAPWLGGLSWILPLPEITLILQLWLPCVALYYVYSIALRWTKSI